MGTELPGHEVPCTGRPSTCHGPGSLVSKAAEGGPPDPDPAAYGRGCRQSASDGSQDGEPGQGSQREPAVQRGERSGGWDEVRGSVLKEASEGCEHGRG